MKFKKIRKMLFMMMLSAGIVVTSTPVPVYAALIEVGAPEPDTTIDIINVGASGATISEGTGTTTTGTTGTATTTPVGGGDAGIAPVGGEEAGTTAPVGGEGAGTTAPAVGEGSQVDTENKTDVTNSAAGTTVDLEAGASGSTVTTEGSTAVGGGTTTPGGNGSNLNLGNPGTDGTVTVSVPHIYSSQPERTVTYKATDTHIDMTLEMDNLQDYYECFGGSSHFWAINFSDGNNYRMVVNSPYGMNGTFSIPEMNGSFMLKLGEYNYQNVDATVTVSGNVIQWSADIPTYWNQTFSLDDFSINSYEASSYEDPHITSAVYDWEMDVAGKVTIRDKAAGSDGRPLLDLYRNMDSVTSIDLDVTSWEVWTGYFSNFPNLETVRIRAGQIADNSTFIRLFYNCPKLKSVDLNGLDASEITSMQSMFSNCQALETVDLGGMNTSNLTDTCAMFSGCGSLKAVDLTSFDTSNVTNACDMFNCRNELYGAGGNYIGFTSSLESITFGSQCTFASTYNMSGMFANCSNLKQLDLSSFNTSNVTYMSNMFNGCKKLESLNLSSFDTSNVENMYYMFGQCSSLQTLDLSNFDTSKVTNVSGMFVCYSSVYDEQGSYAGTVTNLKSIIFGDQCTFANVTSMQSMFYGCSKLEALDLSSFNTSNVTNMNLMFSGCSSLTQLNMSSFNTSSLTSMREMFRECVNLEEIDLTSFDTSNVTDVNFAFNCSKVYTDENHNSIELDPKLREIKFGEDCTFESLDSMAYMFMGCRSLEALDLSSFDTSNVTSFAEMFSGCSSLTQLDLSGFNTSNVTDMVGMFQGCASLSEIDLSSFDTSKVTNASGMFACSSYYFDEYGDYQTIYPQLTKATFGSNCTFASATDLSSMFSEDLNLQSLDLSMFDTSNCTDMSSMFFQCSGLESVNLNSFDTSKVTDVFCMFYGCSGLKQLNLSHFDLSAVEESDGFIEIWGSQMKKFQSPKNVSFLAYLPDVNNSWLDYETMEETSELPKNLSDSKYFVVAPEGMPYLDEVTVGEGRIRIDWGHRTVIEPTCQYSLWRKKGDGDWQEIQTLTLGDPSSNEYYQDEVCWDNGIEVGATYSYYVQLKIPEKENPIILHTQEETVVAEKETNAPKLERIRSFYYSNRVLLEWKENKGIECYQILRKTGSGGWDVIGTSLKPFYTDTTADPGVTYTYTVRGISRIDGSFLTPYDTAGLQTVITEPTPGNGKFVAPEELRDEDNNVYDLGGMEITIRDWWSSEEEEYVPGDEYEEEFREYLDWMQDTYHFTIKKVAISDWGSAPEDFLNYVDAGGDEENYVFTLRSDPALINSMKTGYFYDLSALDCLDFSEAKFQSNRMHEKYSFEGKIYAMSGDAAEPRTGVFFNKRLLTEAGIDPDSLYTMQANGTWTWDAFVALCEQVKESGVYACNCNNGLLTEMAVYSNGGEFVGIDESGNYVNKLNDPKTVEGLEFAKMLFDTYWEEEPGDAPWDYYKDEFLEGKYAFLFDQSYMGMEDAPLYDMEDDWGFVMFPKGPQATDYVNCWDNNPVAIPNCYDEERAWNIAFAWNLYTNEVPGYGENDAWKTPYYEGYRDTRAVDETLAMMKVKGMITYHDMVPELQIGPELTWELGPGANSPTVSQIITNISELWEGYVEEANGEVAAEFGHTCSFQSKIEMNYKITADLSKYDDFWLAIERQTYKGAGEEFYWETAEVRDWYPDPDDGRYVFVFNDIAAAEMGELIRAKVVAVKNGKTYESDIDEYSLKTYAENRIRKSSNPKFIKLMVDMLNYGAAAQVYFKKNTNHLVNAGLTDDERKLGTQEEVTPVIHESVTNKVEETARIVSKSVAFNSGIELNVHVNYDEEPAEDEKVWVELTYVATSGESKRQVVTRDKFVRSVKEGVVRYSAAFDIIATPDAGKEVTLKVFRTVEEDGVPTDVQISETYTYSIETYAANRLENSKDDNFKALLREMLKYERSALAYFTKPDGGGQ